MWCTNDTPAAGNKCCQRRFTVKCKGTCLHANIRFYVMENIGCFYKTRLVCPVLLLVLALHLFFLSHGNSMHFSQGCSSLSNNTIAPQTCLTHRCDVSGHRSSSYFFFGCARVFDERSGDTHKLCKLGSGPELLAACGK